MLKLLVLAELALGGGSLSLFLAPLTWFRFGLACLGILVILVLSRQIVDHRNRILQLIRFIGEHR